MHKWWHRWAVGNAGGLMLGLTLALATGAAQAAETSGGERQLKLVLPEDVRELPKIESTRIVVYRPKGTGGDFTYHHNAVIEHWKGRFYVSWTAAPRSEWTYPYRAQLASSPNGTDWSEPIDPFAAGDEAYRTAMIKRQGVRENDRLIALNCAPRNFLATKDKLYLWTLGFTVRDSGREWVGRVAWTEDGETWHEIAPEELDTLQKEKGLGDIRDKGSNKQFVHLSDGRLMASAGTSYPTTKDPTGLTGWAGPTIALGECKDPGEPNSYEGPDGVLHGMVRFDTRIWHTYSEDGGQHWTTMTRQADFPDNPGNKDFGKLPNGSIWYVGGPKPGSRMELVLGVSKDGWTFDRNYLVRWEQIEPIWYSQGKSEDRPGYEYPTALVHDGFLYVVYSRTRDYIEISKVKIEDIAE